MVKSLSVFFPAYNEKDNLKETTRKAVNVLKSLGLKWEILIVDDGSRDGTDKVADSLSKEDKNIRVIHQPNGGYGTALRTGFYSSKNEWIVYTDSDGQFDFSEISKFLEKADQADLVWGYRIKRNDPFFRLVLAKGWKLVIFLFFGFALKDVDCGFKMVKRQVIEEIPPLKSTRGGMINAELAIKAKQSGFKIVQVGVNHYPRKMGKPTGADIRVIFQSFVDLLKLRFNLV